MEVDLEKKLYCGISLDWNYDNMYVDLSMPNYVQKQLDRYGWKKPKRPQDCPYEPAPIKYGKKSDELVHKKESPPLGKDEQKFIQQVIGSFFVLCTRRRHDHLNCPERNSVRTGETDQTNDGTSTSIS